MANTMRCASTLRRYRNWEGGISFQVRSKGQVTLTHPGQKHDEHRLERLARTKKAGAAGNPTYAMITSRSYHVGLVNVARLNGSLSSITDSVDLETSHALGTRNGDEVIKSEH